MKELLTQIAKTLVDNPDEVQVNVVEKEHLTVLQLTVAKEDMGKVIGRKGKIAQAIRTVIKAATPPNDKKVVVDIL
ncbi:MAG: KH domain-containing protein [Clostridia bacterium]|nr:KH domain-containing protein [Clostridia bacterium]